MKNILHIIIPFIGMLLSLNVSYARDIQSHIPIIELTFEALSKDTFSAATLRLIDESDTLQMPCTIRHRGATSTKYQKQSYAIKLQNEEGEKVDTALLGLRSDNYWILDAMASDKARMRTKIGMELWMDFSAKPWYIEKEPKMQNGSNGHFVEVYVNEDYRGIYHLMERIDRKQLKLKKTKDSTIRGVLYKSVSNAGTFFSDVTQSYNNQSDRWERYEYQYPDVEDSLINWEPLYNAFYFAQHSNSEEFITQAALLYDIPVFMDYYLWAALLSARDNMGKNIYLSYYDIQTDSKLLPTPWDIDHSWGRQYNGTIESATQYIPNWGRNLYARLKNESPDFQQNLIDRYAVLRSGVFSNDSLKKRFEQYFELFRTTEAGDREEARWNDVNGIALDFQEEEIYIKNWIDARLVYLDSIFEYEEPVPTEYNTLYIDTENDTKPVKLIENGDIFIIYRGGKYNILGTKIQNITL